MGNIMAKTVMPATGDEELDRLLCGMKADERRNCNISIYVTSANFLILPGPGSKYNQIKVPFLGLKGAWITGDKKKIVTIEAINKSLSFTYTLAIIEGAEEMSTDDLLKTIL